MGTLTLEPTVTIAEPLTSAEDESLELGIGRSIPELTRTGAAFRRNESGDGELSAQNLGNLLRQLSTPPTGEIANLIGSFKRSGKNFRPMATAFNAT